MLRLLEVMEKKVLVVCGIVCFLSGLSAVLAIAAEVTKVKHSDVEKRVLDDEECPSSPASSWLGFVSALALLIDQFIITAITGCFCCNTSQASSTNKLAIGVCGYIIHWVAFGIAFTMLFVGASLNFGSEDDGGDCLVLMDGFFSGAAIVAIASVLLGLVAYVSSSSPHRDAGSDGTGRNEVVMGAVACSPPQNRGSEPRNEPPPVLDHEDTYRQRHHPEN